MSKPVKNSTDQVCRDIIIDLIDTIMDRCKDGSPIWKKLACLKKAAIDGTYPASKPRS